MRLDHISYVASHDQISDVVNRIGSQIGTAFVDGGIHPKFGTRNFTAPLLNNQYIEVVCPLDHPATYSTPFGRAVKKKAEEGGGWLTWVFSLTQINVIEKRLKRDAVYGSRTKPDGTELKWKQIGVNNIIDNGDLPFFIEWLTDTHPSKDGVTFAKIQKIIISSANEFSTSLFSEEIIDALDDIKVEWVNPNTSEGYLGIVSVELLRGNNLIVID